MSLFDSYFDPQQFQDSGGLLGRLLSLHQGQYQPDAGVDPQGPAYGQSAFAPQATASLPTISQTSLNTTPAPAAPQAPDLGDRLSAGFQGWAHTPVGNPFAALANGITGFGAGLRASAADVVPAQTPQQGPAQSANLGDRLSAGFQSWAHTPVGNPIAGIVNAVAGLNSGQRTGQIAGKSAGADLARDDQRAGQANLDGSGQPPLPPIAAPARKPSGSIAPATGRVARINIPAVLPRQLRSKFRSQRTAN